MLVTGIKSKPVYAPLRADAGGRYHLMLGLGPGAAAVMRVLAELKDGSPTALARTRVLYVAGGLTGSDIEAADALEQSGVAEFTLFGGTPSLLRTFRDVLDESFMGTRLYVAGPESFIGLAMKLALEFDLNKDEIRAEEVGTAARRVYCVHCRATAEDVRTNIVRCGGCQRWLLVRDHYSRRLAAYMGVMVDAEVPGEMPTLKEIYS